MSTTGIGPIDQSLLPAEVRKGTKADREQYAAAMGFERLLVAQLTKQLAQTAQPSEDEGASAATNAYRSMLPDVLADTLTSSGGLGVARSIYEQLKTENEPSA
jgi:Rod binding domain-containing protein